MAFLQKASSSVRAREPSNVQPSTRLSIVDFLAAHSS